MEYQDFIASKVRRAKPMGFDVALSEINANLKDWQALSVRWALKRGRSALFQSTGLGKTIQQLEWASHVSRYTGKPVIVHCPVGVRQQTKREFEKFGIVGRCEVVDEGKQTIDGVNLVNYEKLHKFEGIEFGGVVLDESQILKNYTGKIKQMLIDRYRDTPFRLACTATPSPNDHKELGNHADFLGVMPSNEMLSRWFINDTMKAGGYRLKMHAAKDFWQWVASWAICISKPSQIGGSDEGYDLPPYEINKHVVSIPYDGAAEGFLFDVHGISATNIHEEKKRSNQARAAKVAELVKQKEGSVLIWCHTDYEADELKKAVPEAVEVRGSMKDSVKEQRLLDFAEGKIRVLLTKPTIAGAGLNFQICSQQIFAGISFSFEDFYQAVRRSWRFGQKNQVTVDVILSDAESAIEKSIANKEALHNLMESSMAEAMGNVNIDLINEELCRERYVPTNGFSLPRWLTSKEAVL